MVIGLNLLVFSSFILASVLVLGVSSVLIPRAACCLSLSDLTVILFDTSLISVGFLNAFNLLLKLGFNLAGDSSNSMNPSFDSAAGDKSSLLCPRGM